MSFCQCGCHERCSVRAFDNAGCGHDAADRAGATAAAVVDVAAVFALLHTIHWPCVLCFSSLDYAGQPVSRSVRSAVPSSVELVATIRATLSLSVDQELLLRSKFVEFFRFTPSVRGAGRVQGPFKVTERGKTAEKKSERIRSSLDVHQKRKKSIE